MENIEISFSAVFHLDNLAKSANEMQPPTGSGSLETYVLNIAKQLVSGSQHKAFGFSSENTIFKDSVKDIWDNQVRNSFSTIATKLAEAEGQSPQRSRIPVGSLVLAFGSIGQGRFILAAKIDRTEFLNDLNFEFESGLPFDRFIYKACLVRSETTSFPIRAFVFDSVTAGYAKYWWSDFLGLEEERSNAQNTLRAFKYIEGIVQKLSRWKSDYFHIRNSLVHFFKTKEAFNINELVNHVIGSYHSMDDSLQEQEVEELMQQISMVRSQILEAPARGNFDQAFQIEPQAIKARIKKIVNLRNELELVIKSDYAPGVIKSVIDDGNKSILIRTEVGYDSFKVPGES